MPDAAPPAKPSRAPQAAGAAAGLDPFLASPKVDVPPVGTAQHAPAACAIALRPIPEAVAESGRPIAPARTTSRCRRGERSRRRVPRVAMQAQAEVARVLWAAANAQDPRQEREVVDYAQAIWVRDGATGYSQVVEPAAARRLNDEAMQAYRVRRNVAEAFDLSLKAFGANPGDPEIAGNLAFLHLRLSPAQPETARQLALHAIAVRGSRFRTGRLEDWNTYALASAMTGRDADAQERDVRHRGAGGKRRAQLQGRA